MTAQAEAQPIPSAKTAARLVRNLQTMLATVTYALDSGAAQPGQVAHWMQARTLLEKEVAAGQRAEQELELGAPETISRLASRLRFLARSMDGYRMDFAGPAIAERLEGERRHVVLAAWQVYRPGPRGSE